MDHQVGGSEWQTGPVPSTARRHQRAGNTEGSARALRSRISALGARGLRAEGTTTGLQDGKIWLVSYKLELDPKWGTLRARVTTRAPSARWTELMGPDGVPLHYCANSLRFACALGAVGSPPAIARAL
jgi:hypothetical protein